ncbi:class I SAM-dependent methyltransferase [Streptomyces zagrosensis]|uniref:Ubiquinone/menaquinone biosynthesis C-methylase UbiE n=1 Tax=Streptomyces zagrosensis TaxID=1042984 RepID=A0A7W9QEE7_9ACTN|nr:class I SAM-dependent methyltransferase [Streptomyces zagrosensis]MBB5938756.1 ubiquinone/menaquinone biosynthesis C-methylase UbiE [Streptomyces zagrosensis]
MTSTSDHQSGEVDQAVLDGQAAYHPRALAFYDLMVFRGSAPLFWRCSPRNFQQMYDTSIGAKHLEIGVGTGYLLAHTRFPVSNPKITLADLNPSTLEFTARRLALYETTQVVANALEPIPVPAESHDSAALSFLLHCVPGSLREKGVAIRHAAAAVKPGGTVFGSTILYLGVPVTRSGRWLMDNLNGKGVFHNNEDHLEDLRDQLKQNFDDFDLVVRGSVGLFRGRKAA